MRQVINYSFRIEVVGDTDAPNPLHLCEEIQAYLNAHVCTDDPCNDTFEDVRVTGYKFEYDTFTPTQFDYEI